MFSIPLQFSRKPKAPPPTQPTQTLYVRNLNEQMNHSKLKIALENLFSSYGKILDIKLKRNIKHR
jgi:RNA recognition motif-containing protein